MITANFFESNFCQDIEVPFILDRHYSENLLVVPIIADYVAWEGSVISKFQAIPSDGSPVVAKRPKSKAWKQVIVELRKRINETATMRLVGPEDKVTIDPNKTTLTNPRLT